MMSLWMLHLRKRLELAPIDIAQLEAISSSICDVFREVDPKTTTVLSQILSNKSLETALQVRTVQVPKIVSYAAALSCRDQEWN